LPFDGRSGHFAPVRVNDGLTFLFDEPQSTASRCGRCALVAAAA
jgi:hypothetical protein